MCHGIHVVTVYGVRGNINSWFKSYLTDRRQLFEIKQSNHINSEWYKFLPSYKVLKHGMPQSSGLSFASCFVWVWNLVSYTEEGIQIRVFKNRALSMIFGPKWYKVTGQSRRLQNIELDNLFSSPDIIWVIKSRMRWLVHVARMGTGFWWGNLRGRDHLEALRGTQQHNISMDLQEVGCWAWNELPWLRTGAGGSCVWLR